MNISKSTWHFKLVDWFDWWRPTTLCEYIWKLFWALLLVAVIVPITVTGMGIDAFVWFVAPDELPEDMGPGGWFIDYMGWNADNLILHISLIISMMLGGLAWVLAACAALLFTIAGVCVGGEKVLVSTGVGPKTSTLVTSWWEAHKKKYCPIIEYED